jgi:hypothetical protein
MKTLSALKLSALSLGALVASIVAPEAAQASPTWISCTPVQSMAYSSRIHVKCSASVGGIYYFAASTSNADNAARMLSTINAGLVSGRTLSILYDPADLSGSSIGCSNSDCRLIQAVGIK